MLTANSQPEANSQELIWAVISYVPADIAWCEWLYFTLNGYPVPIALTARATRDGFGLPQELTVFPDPNDRDYAGRYPQALEAGRYLVVICSPNSEHSDTVDNHIRDFKRAGGEERIIVLVVEGEPTKGAGRMNPGPSKWLPPWLRWRIDENGSFRPAERSEPQIIDARPGRMNLDDIMASLLAALLDIPRPEFDVASGPEPLPPARDESHLLEHEGMVDQIWAELAAPVHPTAAAAPATTAPPTPQTPPSAPEEKRGKGGKVFPTILGISIVAVTALALGAAVGWLMSPGMENRGEHASRVSLIRSQPTKEDAAAPERSPASAPEPSSAPVSTLPAKTETIAAPPPDNGSPASITGAIAPSPAPAPTAPTATAAPPPAIPAQGSGVTTIKPAQPQQLAPPTLNLTPQPTVPGPSSATTNPPVLSPEQIAEEAANQVLKAANDARAKGDRLMRDGQVVEALPFYLRALNSTERYSALRPGDESASLETAKLCLIVGSLQATYASTAEARQTLDAGRRMLGKAKGKGSDERSRTLNSLQLQIHRLDEDAPRHRAERD